ncbi:MAG: hypothetical protein JXR75_00265 [Rhodobacteraceae bacterium]|nr:hypothetical protein [Paracoccaceae bacterium]
MLASVGFGQENRLMWKLQTIQAIWFITDLNVTPANTLFKIAFGHDPDNFQTNRALGPGNSFLSHAAGHIDGMTVTFSVQPGRLSLAITPFQQEIDFSQPFLSIDQASATEMHARAANAISEYLNGVVRNATVASFVMPVASYAEAAQVIFGLTHTDLSAENVSDIEFQMNRPTTADDGAVVNRLLKYNVLGMQVVVGNQPGIAATHEALRSDLHAVSLMIDVNVVPNRGILDSAIQKSLFKLYMEQVLHVLDENGSALSLW